MTRVPHAFFLPAAELPTGQRFCIFHAAQGETVRGRVVYVHPFAEEMNKSRRMAAMQSRALSAAGFSVLQIDLYGCGDSSGDFGDASWEDWIKDVVQGVAWITQLDAAHAAAPLWLWGLRAGCLLASQAAARLQEPSNFCFWQPATSGKQLVQQFLRLKMAAGMLSSNSKGLMEELKLALAQGQSLEIAGYTLPSALAEGLGKAVLAAPADNAAHCSKSSTCRLEWFELNNRNDAQLSPATQQYLQKFAAASFQTQHHFIQGPSFWQTQEVEDATALIEATCAALVDSSETPFRTKAVA